MKSFPKMLKMRKFLKCGGISKILKKNPRFAKIHKFCENFLESPMLVPFVPGKQKNIGKLGGEESENEAERAKHRPKIK